MAHMTGAKFVVQITSRAPRSDPILSAQEGFELLDTQGKACKGRHTRSPGPYLRRALGHIALLHLAGCGSMFRQRWKD